MTSLVASVCLVTDLRGHEPPEERAVWLAEGLAVCAALGVLLVAFGAYLALAGLVPEALVWLARAGSAAAGFWLASRAYRIVLRSRGFDSSGLGIRIRQNR